MLTIDEGVVKFQCDWTPGPPVPDSDLAELIEWRNRLYCAGLIGHDAVHDVGFGNVSCRRPGQRSFVISATQTGHIATATAREFTQVLDYDIGANRVICLGPQRASSESMTHATIYELDTAFLAVVHVHHLASWRSMANRVPTTHPKIAYGTPAMAAEFRRLYAQTDFPVTRLAVMAGHEAGVISVGTTLEEAAKRVLDVMRA